MEGSGPFIYRASELGGCVKALTAKRMGYEPIPYPESLTTIFAEGNLHEEAVVRSLVDGGNKVWNQQLEVNLPITSSVVVQGHIDGLVNDDNADWLLEIKSMSSDRFKEYKRLGWATPGLIQKYKWQVSAYMIATSLPLMFVVKDRNAGTILSDKVMTPFYSEVEIRARVLGIEALSRVGLPAECDVRIWPCPVSYLHDDEVEVMEDAEIDLLARQYKDAKAKENVAKEMVGVNYKALMKGLGDRKKVKTLGGVQVTKYVVKSKSLDKKKLAEDGLIEKYEVVTEREQMKVTIDPTPAQ